MPSNRDGCLRLLAGATAAEQLRERGFEADLFSTLVGASGGPKWLVLGGLDRALARRVVAGRRSPLDLLGSSIGAFRHACLAQSRPEQALARFETAYLAQSYPDRPAAAEVSAESRRILQALLGREGAGEIVENTRVRSHIVTTRLRIPRGLPVRLGVGAAALANAFSRASLAVFLERIVFSSDVGAAPGFEALSTRHVALRPDNLEAAVLASGSIPFVMESVWDPPAAPPGVYLDGGLLDYHFDFRLRTRPGLVLFPHFFDRITPGWFDKALPWRRPGVRDLDRVLLVAPSADFVRSLPGGRVPDRLDFQRLPTRERQRIWREVVARCAQLGEVLEDWIESGRIGDRIEPFAG